MSWVEHAACRGLPPSLFFPDSGEPNREAKRVCESCEVRGECLDEANRTRERWGVWGGLSVKDRQQGRTADTMHRDCTRCGWSFVPYSNAAKYCSPRCREAAAEQARLDYNEGRRNGPFVASLSCGWCEEEFTARHTQATYCSGACRQAARRAGWVQSKRRHVLHG